MPLCPEMKSMAAEHACWVIKLRALGQIGPIQAGLQAALQRRRCRSSKAAESRRLYYEALPLLAFHRLALEFVQQGLDKQKLKEYQ